MPENKAWKGWVKAFGSAGVALGALIAYASTRDWFIHQVSMYYVGFFEGFCATVIAFLFAIRFGDAINEVVLGLRELGRKSKLRKVRKESRQHKRKQNQQ